MKDKEKRIEPGRFSMKNIPLYKKLKKEKEKLNRLANEALRNGIPLTKDKEFMAQNQKVDVLVAKIQKEIYINQQR